MKTNDVLTHFGGKRATAEALGLSTQAVQAWKSIIPQKQAWRIDRLRHRRRPRHRSCIKLSTALL